MMAFIFATMVSHAQSTAETAEKIQVELGAIKAEFVATLQSAAANPEKLQSGQTQGQCEQILAKLDELQSRINEASDLLAKRETDLSAKTGISQADQLELKQALQNQRKPLESSKQSANKLESELKSFNGSKINEIQEIYKNYLDIAGPAKAKTKVEASIQSLLAAYLPPKPKPTPTQRASPQPTPSALKPPKGVGSVPNDGIKSNAPISSKGGIGREIDLIKTDVATADMVTPQQSASMSKTLPNASTAPQPNHQTKGQKKQSISLWKPKDKLPKEVRGHFLAGNFSVRGSNTDGSVILVPAPDANKSSARQFWVVNRSLSGGPNEIMLRGIGTTLIGNRSSKSRANMLVEIGEWENIEVPASRPMIFIRSEIRNKIYIVEAQ